MQINPSKEPESKNVAPFRFSAKLEEQATQERQRSEQKRCDFEAVLERLAQQDGVRASKQSLDDERRSQKDRERAAQRSKMHLKEQEDWMAMHAQVEAERAQRVAKREQAERILLDNDTILRLQVWRGVPFVVPSHHLTI